MEAFPSEIERGSKRKRKKENSTQTTSMCLDLKEPISLKLENHQLKYENEDLKKKINPIAKSKELALKTSKKVIKTCIFTLDFHIPNSFAFGIFLDQTQEIFQG